MKECIIDREQKGPLDVVHLDGALDALAFPRLEAMLTQLRDSQRHSVILDCSKLEYISSAALGALIGFARRSRENQGDLKLVKLSPKIRNIIELLGFHKILEIYEDEDQAVRHFR